MTMHITYLQFQQDVSPSIAFPDWDTVFAPGAQASKSAIAPLARLQGEGFGGPEVLPVLYWEAPQVDYVRMAMTNGLIASLTYTTTRGDVIDDVEPFEDPLSQEAYAAELPNGRHLTFETIEVDYEPPQQPDNLDDSDGINWRNAIADNVYSAPGVPNGLYFSPIAYPIQNGFTVPKDSGGKSMQFIGQISAMEFYLADRMFYLYYSPETGEVVQYMQMT